MKIWLIRHGTTAANREGRLQGRLDIPLAPQGRREAEQLARRLREFDLEVVLSSDLSRAWETARIIAWETDLQPVRMPLLRECSWGIVEGMTIPEIKARYPGEACSDHFGLKAGLFGGERERKLMARAGLVYKIIEQRYRRCGSIALVSHGRFLNAFLAKGLGLKARQRWPFAPAPASLSLITFDSSRDCYRLALFNDRCHLQTEASLYL